MTDWQIALTVVGSILGYGFIAGLTFALADAMTSWDSDDSCVWAAIFWPLVLPGLLGAGVVRVILRRATVSSIPPARVVERP